MLLLIKVIEQIHHRLSPSLLRALISHHAGVLVSECQPLFELFFV